MGGYCGDSYYRTDEEHKRDMFWVKISIFLMFAIPVALISITPMFYA